MTASTRSRRACLIAGVLALVASFSMAAMVDAAVTQPWSDAARTAWSLTLVSFMVGGVIAVCVGLGAVSEETLREIGDAQSPSPTIAQFVAVYAGALVFGVALATVLETRFGVASTPALSITGGALFLWAATRRPPIVFAVVRRLGWFAGIDSDSAMQWILAILGAVLLALGLGSSVTPPNAR